MRRPLSCVVLLALSAACPAATTRPSELPVTAVTLYTSGVGHFRHEGPATGDGEATLRFKADQINDVIKSLVVQTTAGGRVVGVQYPSQDPLDKTLKTFRVDLTGEPGLFQLLSQLRGARVTVAFNNTKTDGTVVGVETRPKKVAKDGEATQAYLLNLFDGSVLSQVDFDAITQIRLEDAELSREFVQALGVLAGGRDQDKKPVTIRYTGRGEHRLSVGYVVATPVWKVAYRLLLDDWLKLPPNTPATMPPPQDRLQAWAVVENQTDSDWHDVSLGLVSGRPISFVMNLYEPLYLERNSHCDDCISDPLT